MKQKLIILILCIITFNATARLQIRRVGSATILPFTQEVSDLFAIETKNFQPYLTTNGSGAGITEFCASNGPLSPDQVDASRSMTQKELETCAKNGVTEIIKLTIGRNGMCLLHSKKALEEKGLTTFSVTPEQIFLAIVKEIPNGEGKLIVNPYKTWHDIDQTLPKAPIRVRIPPSWHGTRGDFDLMVMDSNCEKLPWIKELKATNPKRVEQICRTLREDKNIVTILQDFELAENGNVLIDKIRSGELGEVAIAGCNIYMLHSKQNIAALSISGVAPSMETLKDGSYPLIHFLQIYFKKAHINLVPGLEEFIKLYSSQKIIGPDGLLRKYGIIPMDVSDNPITYITPTSPAK